MCEKSLAEIVNTRANAVQRNEQMDYLEQQSYEMTIVNQSKVATREKLVELLPEMVTVCQKKKKQSSVGFMMAGLS